MTRPLLSGWMLHADVLPERLLDAPAPVGFTLPGAQALADFADLLGDDSSPQDTAEQPQAVRFPLPAMLDIPGEVTLTQEIDFGALHGDRAQLTLEGLVGCGRVLLGSETIASFGGAAGLPDSGVLAADLTGALQHGRRETLSIEFGSVRPAGIRGAVMLHTAHCALLCAPALTPDAAQKTMTASVRIEALRAGTYALRMQYAPPAAGDEPTPAREITLTLAAGESRSTQITMAVPGDPFAPGRPYPMGAVRLLLERLPDAGRGKPANAVNTHCDSTLLPCGYAGKAPCAYVPLDRAACLQPDIADRLRALHISGVRLDAPAPDAFYRAMSRAGIAVIQTCDADDPLRARLAHMPCVTFASAAAPQEAASLAASAWQLCGMTGYSRAVDPSLTERELLADAAGRALHPDDEGTHGVLLWLRAVLIRLRAEAARQGRYTGALCAAGEIDQSDIAASIRTAFAPVHLSALPLCGAWWTGSRFSAALSAFLPEGREEITALAVLEDEAGHELARLSAPCAKDGPVGVIEAVLPDSPCVLELTTRLLARGEVIEESTLPVYVGERGPLEAGFTL